jgi:glycosyltransferase involved in cell wall biosynthesis
MKTLFIGVHADYDIVELINSKSVDSAQVSISAIKYSKAIADGLDFSVPNHTNLFLIPMGMYPKCSLFFFKEKKNSNNYYIPFVNLYLIKQLSIFIYTLFFVLIWNFKYFNSKRVVFLGFLYLPFLLALFPFRFLTNVKLVSFVPDLPNFIFSYTKTNFFSVKFINNIYIILTNEISKIINYFVFVTDHMKNFFPLRPYSVIEGLINFNSFDVKRNENFSFNKRKAIMYAGALYEKFGINVLVDAFMDIPGDYELWLFGYGDYVEIIKEKARIDKRIIFFGNVSNDIIIDFELKARLLVNPRPLNHEFNKVTFPSKILEYMTSGTPVLTTKLDGIPNDYEDKLYFFKDDSFASIKNGIIEHINLPDEKLYLFGRQAMSFSLLNKNNFKQISELLKFIDIE